MLDIDNTLLHFTSSLVVNRSLHLCKGLYLRPGLLEFIQNLKASYDLVLWSSGTYEYVREISELLSVDVFYSREDCIVAETTIKILATKGLDTPHTIVVDDLASTFSKNEFSHSIHVPPFYADHKNAHTDRILSDVLIVIRTMDTTRKNCVCLNSKCGESCTKR